MMRATALRIGLALALAVPVLSIATERAEAVDEWLFAATYAVGIPVSDTREFTSSASFRGVALEGRHFFKRNASLGGYFGWSVFNEETSDLAVLNNISVSGTQFRYINTFPILLQGHYYSGTMRSRTRFFGGLGAGGFITERRLEIGVSAFEENKWQWGFAPEVGVMTQLNDYVNGMLTAKFNYGFESGDLPALSYFSIGVGIAGN